MSIGGPCPKCGAALILNTERLHTNGVVRGGIVNLSAIHDLMICSKCHRQWSPSARDMQRLDGRRRRAVRWAWAWRRLVRGHARRVIATGRRLEALLKETEGKED